MSPLLVLALVIAVVLVLLLHLRSAAGLVFRVTFQDGECTGHEGAIPHSVRGSVMNVASTSHVSGTVSYFGSGRLGFSDGISDVDCERFRNAMGLLCDIHHPRAG